MADSEARRRRATQRPEPEAAAPTGRSAPARKRAGPAAVKAVQKKAARTKKAVAPVAVSVPRKRTPPAVAKKAGAASARAPRARRSPPAPELVTEDRVIEELEAEESPAEEHAEVVAEAVADAFPEPEERPRPTRRPRKRAAAPAVAEAAPDPEREPSPEDVRAALRARLAEAAARTSGRLPPAPQPAAAEPPRLEAPPVEAPPVEARPEPEPELEPEPEPAPEPERGPEPEPTRPMGRAAAAWEPTVTTTPPEDTAQPTATTPPPLGRAAPTPPAPPTPPKQGRKLRTVGIVAAVAVVAAIVVVGLALLLSNVLGEDGVNYAELQPGQCFDRPSGRFNNVEAIPCDEEHDLEVYGVLDHPAAAGDPFPGMDELLRYASPLCLSQFRDYAGAPFEQLSLRDVYITPRESAWNDDARRIVCAVGTVSEEPTSTSVKAGG